MHPAALSDEDLLRECTLRFHRRSGPGGQHRNKVETAVELQHEPSGITAEASERRSQADNRRVALERLRLTLALEWRDEPTEHPSQRWQARCRNSRLSVSPSHDDFAPLVAELLDFLAAHEFSLPKAAEHFQVSGSQLVKLARSQPAILAFVNSKREALSLHKLT